ncbi:MAG: hypothetical protein ACPGUC_08075 [Gammaproteobacteria bacterium]
MNTRTAIHPIPRGITVLGMALGMCLASSTSVAADSVLDTYDDNNVEWATGPSQVPPGPSALDTYEDPSFDDSASPGSTGGPASFLGKLLGGISSSAPNPAASGGSAKNEYLALKRKLGGLSGAKTRFLCDNDGCLDLTTNLVWHRHGFHDDFGRRKQKLPDPRKGAAFRDWIRDLNTRRVGGHDDWRLPDTGEYILANFGAEKDTLGWIPGILKRGKGVDWTFETAERELLRYASAVYYKRNGELSYYDPKKIKSWKYVDASAVRTGPLDLLMIELSERNPRPLSADELALYGKIRRAYSARLIGPALDLWEQLIDQAGHELYLHGFTRKVNREGMTEQVAVEILVKVKDKESHSPAFWFEYARMALDLGQPALALQAARGMKAATPPPGLETEVAVITTLIEAEAYRQLGKADEGYTALLMQDSLRDSLLAPPFIGRYAPGLLLEREKLMKITGWKPMHVRLMPKAMAKIVAQGRKVPFVNLETGKTVDPDSAGSASRPASSKPNRAAPVPAAPRTTSPAKPSAPKPKRSGVTVLD